MHAGVTEDECWGSETACGTEASITTRIHDTLERVRTALADIHALQAGRRVLATAEPGSGDCLACVPGLTLPCFKLAPTLLECATRGVATRVLRLRYMCCLQGRT